MDNEADCCCKVVRERGGEDDYFQVARPYLNLLGRVIGFLFLYPHDQLFSPHKLILYIWFLFVGNQVLLFQLTHCWQFVDIGKSRQLQITNRVYYTNKCQFNITFIHKRTKKMYFDFMQTRALHCKCR